MKTNSVQISHITTALLVIIGVLTGVLLTMLSSYFYNPNYTITDTYDHYVVACSSNSMGQVIDCDDLVYIEPVGKLKLGDIYVYYNEDKNSNVTHRLVYCLDKDCNQTIFKGDNNKVAELVNKSQILGRVKEVKYR